MQKLKEWIQEDAYEPDRLAYKLRAVRDGKRFAATTVIVEVPGKVCLIERVPYPVMMADDPDCLTAKDFAFGKPFLKIDLI